MVPGSPRFLTCLKFRFVSSPLLLGVRFLKTLRIKRFDAKAGLNKPF
jgi:hypothetical protein